MPADVRQLRAHFEQLKQQRSGWEALWRDIRDYILPDMGCFEGENTHEGGKRYLKLRDATATNYADVLAAGLLGGVSSPSRPWLRLTTLDGELDQSPQVKEWLDEVQRTMLLIFAKADVYNQLHQSYLELPVFGQSCTIAQWHPERVVNLQNLTCGQYWLSEDQFGTVDTLFREISLTAKQMYQMWGDACSEEVKRALDQTPFQEFKVIHAIEPRFERDPRKRDSVNKPFSSVYFEDSQSERVLSESGFDDFPAMTPRWMTVGGSVYGRGPGAKALTSAKALQHEATRLAALIDNLSDPPMTYPATYQGDLKEFRPGGRIPVDPSEEVLIKPAFTAHPQALSSLMELINSEKEALARYFYVNVFQMIAAGQDNDRTATEVAALEQEKALMLGPVLERLHTEMLDPLVTNTFNFMLRAGKVPDIPEELQGQQLNVEYISVLAEQQKNSSVMGLVKLTQGLGLIAQLKPEAVDKFDQDAAVDLLADSYGVPPSVIVSNDRVALIRQQRAEEQQQVQQAQMDQLSAGTLRDLGQAADSQGLREAVNQIQAGEPVV